MAVSRLAFLVSEIGDDVVRYACARMEFVCQSDIPRWRVEMMVAKILVAEASRRPLSAIVLAAPGADFGDQRQRFQLWRGRDH